MLSIGFGGVNIPVESLFPKRLAIESIQLVFNYIITRQNFFETPMRAAFVRMSLGGAQDKTRHNMDSNSGDSKYNLV